MTDAYDLVERAPTLSEYRQICTAVGWDTLINFDAAAASLGNSLYHVVALYDHAIVGMARIVGDGAMYFYIQDVAVLPAHQGHGVGGLLMEHVVAYLRSHAPAQVYSAFESGPTAAGESGPIPGRRRRSPHESLW